jgi:thioredoxin-like negative regulator of GroEL
MSVAKLSSAGFTILMATILTLIATPARAADNLKLNPHLDFQSDSADGPLITGDNMAAGVADGIPNYVIIYAEGCYNSKRQAKRTVSLYEHYRGRVNFVVIDLDRHHSAQQETIIKSYYKGYIPTVVILGSDGAALYSQAGEKEERDLSAILDGALR